MRLQPVVQGALELGRPFRVFNTEAGSLAVVWVPHQLLIGCELPLGKGYMSLLPSAMQQTTRTLNSLKQQVFYSILQIYGSGIHTAFSGWHFQSTHHWQGMLGGAELMAGLIWRRQDRFTYPSGSLVGVTGRLGSSKTGSPMVLQHGGLRVVGLLE